jgi:hypothetical protein
VTVGVDSTGSGYGPTAGCCVYDIGFSGSIKGGEFLDQKKIYSTFFSIFPISL